MTASEAEKPKGFTVNGMVGSRKSDGWPLRPEEIPQKGAPRRTKKNFRRVRGPLKRRTSTEEWGGLDLFPRKKPMKEKGGGGDWEGGGRDKRPRVSGPPI